VDARSVANLQHAVRGNKFANYEAFARSINEQSERLLTIRGLMELKKADTPLDISEVEPADEIVKRFATGAMSFGSISREAHTTLAIAMNRIGGARTPARAARNPTASSRCPTAIRCAAASSRSPRAASA
jgi:glutamate synthase (NADPH/NADH) large chain